MTQFDVLMNQLPAGPWHWRGCPDDVTLCTAHSGWLFLMGVARCGMRGAQFTFQSFQGDRSGYGLQKCHHDGMYVPRAHYAPREIADIDHPLAHLIKRIPEMVQEIARLQEQNARLVQDSQRYLAEIARLLGKCRDLELTLETSAENSGVWAV